MKSNRKGELLFIVVGMLMMAFLIILPTGYEDAVIYREAVRCKVKVLSTDESSVIYSGLIQSGEQICKVEILDGRYKGRELKGVNMLSGSLESDKIFKAGDKALVVISVDGQENPTNVTMSDYYRLDQELILAGLFTFFLIMIAGFNGMRAIFSFIISVLLIWKVLVPLYLNGYNPIAVGLLVTAFLTVMIIFFVWGIDIKSLSAIFISSIVIGSCGAMMDLAVDITSAVNEVVEKKPDIGWKEAFVSGMNVGRAAMGTYTPAGLFRRIY